ncbi:MAG TPA: EAL domain-containing protein, partial [Casimicrobiaceae bacterium]|nr:EAL domain-containing protein [Casimicrobiaceae bacterium]
KLKLDQSFTRDAEQNEGDVAITRAIISMAQSLNLTVVAEGVETQAQIDLLMSLGCTMVQGFLLGRPLPAHETAELLRHYVTSAGAGVVLAAEASSSASLQPRSPAALGVRSVEEPVAGETP